MLNVRTGSTGDRVGHSAGHDTRKKPASWSRAVAEAAVIVRAHRKRLLLGLAILLVNRLAGLVLPWTAGDLIDQVIPQKQHDMLWLLAAAAGAAVVVQAISGFALAQLLGVAAQGAINDLRQRVHLHVLHLPVRRFDETKSGQLISRVMTDAEGVRNLVGNGLVQLIGGLITAALGFAVLCWLDWRLTLCIAGVLALFGGFMAVAFRRLRPLFRERGRIQAEVSGHLGEELGGIRVVKAYAAEARSHAAFSAGVARLFANVKASITGVSASTAAGTVAVGAVSVLLIVLGGGGVLAGRLSLGELVMYLLFVGVVTMPVIQIASIGTQITEAFAGLDRIRELLDQPREDADDATRDALPALSGTVALQGVRFGYDPARPVLHGIDLDAAAGTTTALVGASGSGKSTLVGLIMAFHRPDAGAVLIDGRDLASVRLGDYRRQLGVVLQDNVLFDGSIADNIAFARPDATRADIERVAALAHCDGFVRDFERGYDTVVGERGVKLSGGQRQRIAIARALLADPRILILDEATSALDSESEAQVQDGLRRLREGRTVFVIAHRLSTIRSADRIVVLDQGRIAESGTHAELLAAGGIYRRLHDRQHQTESDAHVNPGEELTRPK